MTKKPQTCRLTVENLVIGERRITDLPVSPEEAMETCMEVERAVRFAVKEMMKRSADIGPLGVSIIRRPGKILVRWFDTGDDQPAAEARFILMLQGDPDDGRHVP